MTINDQLCREYLSRMPGAARAYQSDATYHAWFDETRKLLRRIEEALRNEVPGISDAGIRRVLTFGLWGAFDEGEAIERIERLAQGVGLLRRAAIPIHVVEGLASDTVLMVPEREHGESYDEWARRCVAIRTEREPG
jgi:hypothetical protein